MKNWKTNILSKKLIQKDGIFFTSFKDSLGIKFHEKMPKGAALRELQDTHLHLSYWETPYYKKALDNFLSDFKEKNNKIAIDIGCGDGRFTQYLLESGFQKVISIDTHLKPLISLADYVKRKKYQDKVLIINCSAENIPIKSNSIDLGLAIGVFYYLNKRFENCLREVNRLLKKNALLINSEPDLEGAVYKSIFFEGIDDVIENVNKKKFKEEKGITNFKFRLFEKNDIKHILKNEGFNLLDSHGLSLLPSILRIKMVRGDFSENEIKNKEKKLRKIFDYFDNNSVCKHIIWKSKKIR